ncbi:MAG: GNAT family N-acetyltransferase [Hyphomonadaceae bacterium]
MNLTLRTERLELVAVDHALAVAQIEDRIAFFDMLGVRANASWPPPLLDMEAMCFTRDRLARFPEEVGWQAWVWIDPVEQLGKKELVGFGGFTASPDDEGLVEIGYSVLPSREGFGYASEAVAALLTWARNDKRVRTIVAHTMEDGVASQKLLKKQGFALAQERPYPEVLRWERAA